MTATTAQATKTADRDGEQARALERLAMMLRIRRFEERCGELYQDQKIRGFLHLYIGEEAVASGVMPCLRPDDAVVATYREHGHALARGIPADAVMAEMYGKVTGTSRGRGGSMHLFDAAARFYGGHAIVGAGLPFAAGLALADRLQGAARVTACFFGDGAVAEGEFHETMNLAALWKLPVLFCCENNLYAMGTAIARAHSETNLALKASAYRMPAWPVDGMDVDAVEAATREAVAAIRAGKGPHFLEFRTYRFRPHSLFDPELYRSREEVEAWMTRCPISTYVARLRERAWLDDDALARLEQEVHDEVEASVTFAEESPWESPEELLRFVTSEQVPHA
jgi:pyruvate dehydrogenase E1 component alpha subunit